MADDTSTNWGNLLSGLSGVAGSLMAGHQASSGAENASNLAQFKNINIGLPTGAVSATNANGNLNYGVSSPAAGTYNMFQGLANNYGNAASNPNNPFIGAANKAVAGYQGFDPQAASSAAYKNLSALAAPGETDQTQQMLNYEQATGRGGVTQNGQLGDLGGLALAQSTADNGRRLQAQQLGLQQQESLANQATGLLSAGNQWNTANVNNANTASTAGNNINSGLLDLLRTAITGQSAQATAGANAAQYQYDLGINKSNNTDNLTGSLLQGGANGGGIGNILKGLGGMFGGSGGGGGGFDTSSLYSNGDSYLNNTDFSGLDPNSVASFNGAGGQAATPGLQNLDYSNPNSLSLPGEGTSGTGSFNGLGAASGAFGIANGLSKGGVAGYTGAALGANNLYNSISGNKGANGAAGAAAGALGLYSGLKQGGIAGDATAANGAYQLATGGAIPGVGQALSLYNAINGYKSGSTGSDALLGAQAGASIGSIIPGVGTLIGGAVGGAVGAIASAFGPGAKDPETVGVNKLIDAVGAHPQSAAQLTAAVQNPYVAMAGLFDRHESTLPMYAQYGRMGEQKFTTDLVSKVQAAQKQGLQDPNQIYQSVVAPWVNSMGKGWGNVGSTYQQTTQGLLQNMVGQITSGSYQQNFRAIGGQAIFASPMSGLSAALPSSSKVSRQRM